MGVEQYQRKVNSLDKEIADLEKKKAEEDRKAADNHKKASRVSVSKNASESMIKSKMRQIENYEEKARKAEAASADYGKKISDKRTKRNDAYLKLQKEEQNERKKQEKSIENMKRVYEQRISELESLRLSKVKNGFLETVSGDEPEYDVFVSHAWEDKADFVEAFVQALKDREIKVWYDKSKIKWGDSMRARIDDGLRKSKFGVAILSPNYIAEGKYWTKAELDGLFQMESINGKTLLPIWHNLTKKQVMDYSPILASKLAMTTATMTAEEIADELLDMLSSEEDK
ncbi:TIR domain [Anaerobutyricum hallii]|uniref:TIR domain n=1 Tax=Anaerobutyricum hallii TaxID=39488 RepID=A0A173SGM0_9FIRM|nr:toll/interleukin-1 receptor domain-containing protein [Anaerobutyricum hallii]CUM89522.1 TIR domain [Anaerobutyricum hallii]